MKIPLAYGKKGKVLTLDDGYEVDVIAPKFSGALKAPIDRVRESLRNPYDSAPLNEWALPNHSVGIVFSDITRPVPLKILLPAILEELTKAGVVNIKLFNALGSHRPNSDEELREMLGDAVFEKYMIVQNDAFNRSTHRYFGKTTNGHDIYLNEEFSACDRHIITGFIEPHFFAGFSGGGKAIIPGMAGIETILSNHGPEMISNPNATFGITRGNPIWEEIDEIGEMFKNTFLVNVTLNRTKEITGVFSGNLRSAHAAGCAFAKEMAMVPVSGAYDIVITTNSGYPLDINLYQSVKGISTAARIVKKGGSIIIAAECRDGIPKHGCYGTLLKENNGPAELLENIMHAETITPDQWQAQIQAQIQLNAKVFVYSEILSNAQITSAMLLPCENIEETVKVLLEEYGRDARICVLPEGPQTIPYIKEN